VEFDSLPDAGTTFRVLLPVRSSQPGAAPTSLPAPAESDIGRLSGLRVLLAEDNSVNQFLVKAVLQKIGMVVEVVSNGKEAVEALRTQSFDAVLMDAEMPEMDGYEATAAIRARERETGSHVPIIALTGHASAESLQHCLAAGMDEHLTKPLSSTALLAALLRQTRGRAVPTSPVLDPVALARLRRLADTIPGMLSQVAEAFLHDAATRLAALGRAVETGDADQLDKHAHALKGACVEIGAQGMIPLCRELETLGRSRSVVGAAEALARLNASFGLVRTAVAALVTGAVS
jgi:two-component system sensor histidine kinase/response regulator